MLELFKSETRKRREIKQEAAKTMFTALKGMGASNNVAIKTIEANMAVSAATVYRWLVMGGVIVQKRKTPKGDKVQADKNAGE